METDRHYLIDPSAKRAYNRKLFTRIAPRYDAISRLLSFSRDGSWKRRMIGMLPGECKPDRILDLACGTADLSLLLARRFPRVSVVGCDLTPSMLQIARQRARQAGVSFCCQDMGRLGVRDGAVDLVCGGYALRNAPDLVVTLGEVARVLSPGGVAAFLDFTKSPDSVVAVVQLMLLKIWGSFWGLLMHGKPSVYGYIADSLAVYPNRAWLHRLARLSGLTVLSSRLAMFGMIEILLLTKPAARGQASGS
jgi:demethylmenaquinone methyltransferase/2-methoxy-6-polyprenyl-1,4-benzoquinol methylase